MTATAIDLTNTDYASPAPVLIAGASGTAIERARRTVAASGYRIADAVDIAAAPRRIEEQGRASALWIELEDDCGEPLDRLLDLAGREVESGRFAAIVAAPFALVDPLAAQLPSVVELVIDGSDSDRAAALALALSGAGKAARLSDIASERNTERLRQLSDEVSRIATTLARLSAEPAAEPVQLQKPAAAELPPIAVETVRSVIRARRLRGRYFAEDLFADPAWDMLLDLLQAEIAQLRVPVSSLCIAAAVPATTALRWLKNMVDQGLFVRRADPHDARRVFVELAPQTSLAMRRYFAEVGRPAII